MTFGRWLRRPLSPGTLRHANQLSDFYMQRPCTIGLLSVLLANLAGGCTPYIPVEDAFTTSALKPTGNIPPEFAGFNNYNPEVNALLADQICATPYIPLQEKSLRAAPGELIAKTGRCRPYVVGIHN